MSDRKEFVTKSSIKALLDQLYDIKFSKHTTLVVALLSMIYTVYRTQHYLIAEYGLGSYVAWPTAVFIEMLVISAAAAVFVAMRNQYIAELKGEDAERSKLGVTIAQVSLVAAFVALLFVAFSDGWRLTHQIIPTSIMALTQFSQMLFIVGFISASDLDERRKLRAELENYQEQVERDRQAELERKHMEAEQRERDKEREQYEKEHPYVCGCGDRFKTRKGLSSHQRNKTCTRGI